MGSKPDEAIAAIVVNRVAVRRHRKGLEMFEMKALEQVEQRVSRWAGVSVHAHRFGGREFRLRNAEVGHIHSNGVLDIPFPRSIHDALLDEGLAEKHHWVPNSGWITYRVRSENGLEHAVWLMRLSYLRYALKAAAKPRDFFEQESEQLQLSPRFKSLLESFIPRSGASVSVEAVQS